MEVITRRRFLGTRPCELGAGLSKQLCPVVGVGFLAGELAENVFVTECLRRSEVFRVPAMEILVAKAVLHVHSLGRIVATRNGISARIVREVSAKQVENRSNS